MRRTEAKSGPPTGPSRVRTTPVFCCWNRWSCGGLEAPLSDRFFFILLHFCLNLIQETVGRGAGGNSCGCESKMADVCEAGARSITFNLF